eukprot:8341878-Pyramimonas_sp.AAC.1
MLFPSPQRCTRRGRRAPRKRRCNLSNSGVTSLTAVDVRGGGGEHQESGGAAPLVRGLLPARDGQVLRACAQANEFAGGQNPVSVRLCARPGPHAGGHRVYGRAADLLLPRRGCAARPPTPPHLLELDGRLDQPLCMNGLVKSEALPLYKLRFSLQALYSQSDSLAPYPDPTAVLYLHCTVFTLYCIYTVTMVPNEGSTSEVVSGHE